MQLIIKIAKEKGLSNKQIKKMDIYIATILKKEDLNMLYNYIDTIKNREEMKFIISYDLRTEGIKSEDMLIRKEINKIKKYAIRQKLIRIANVIRDRTKIMIIMRFLGICLIKGNQYEKAITEGNSQK